MALKPSYTIKGEVWIPLSRAAALLVTNTSTIKKLMGDGTLEYTNVPRGRSILVEQAGVLRLRDQRNAASKEAAKRARAPTRTAQERGKSQRAMLPR
jgi:hypothetical protein